MAWQTRESLITLCLGRVLLFGIVQLLLRMGARPGVGFFVQDASPADTPGGRGAGGPASGGPQPLDLVVHPSLMPKPHTAPKTQVVKA